MRINDYDYQVEIVGQGNPTWVFLHGFLGSKADFAKIVPCGTKIYITAYGFAKNDKNLPENNFTVAHQVHDLVALLTALQINSINLVGYSMGGSFSTFLCNSATTVSETIIFRKWNCRNC
ncbi:alpha/beta fold hydrolase [Fructilactobacillus lindneri]|uniref:AB hydrolase-1 domain-containing protein n=1 Tax=Fructilactobacillus lindneri DSM 20690 = JCM 11027 TaxID=1122148 RepID=A0A0R2JWT8_9LACO|nr:alpha/beta fold hydrolase [Fructilactobacillus lindneri]KRN79685.1 hypothetical protein IV52_GL000222 [Fructilactobacillus lindneri DSM 20690 = JCM 11027]SKA07505.1 alpha/beta hydrolase fold [Fructilactobacillus lindneri DSM 20690 = JCM 11027]